MKRLSMLALAAALFALPGCDREDPTTIGAPLVENGSVRTFEVTLNAADFLVRDTAFSAFPAPLANFLLLANSYDNALNAHALAKFAVDPVILVLNSSNQTVVDSTPRVESGRLILPIDSVGSFSEGPVLLRLYRSAQTWDTAAVSWTVRERNGATDVLWTTPGGTRGVLIDTATYTGGDSVVFRVDTITLKEWRDFPATSTGALITSESPHSRLRTGPPILRTSMHTSVGDSTVVVSTGPFATRTITDPAIPAASSDPRVGGYPSSFRSVFEVRENMRDITVPCPFTPTCRIKLGAANIASAELLLQPVASPGGFVPELPVTILAYTLLPTAQVPLIRSPLGQASGALTVGPASFQGTGAAVTPLNVTNFVRDLVTPLDTTSFKSRYLVLLEGVPATFGYASFQGQPKLRLRMSLAQEIQLP
jgi:hypothetical protein